ncbi:MAG: hypothetical protein WCV70_00240 [Patescibacteria group bacterium]|jgi:hypothetical protein
MLKKLKLEKKHKVSLKLEKKGEAVSLNNEPKHPIKLKLEKK